MKREARRLCKKLWAPTKKQEQTTALTAPVEKLRAIKQPLKQPKAPATGTAPKKPKKENKRAWKDALPKAGEPRTKKFEGKDCHCDCCPHHIDQRGCHPVTWCSKNPAKIAAGGQPPPAAASGNHGLQRAQLVARPCCLKREVKALTRRMEMSPSESPAKAPTRRMEMSPSENPAGE